MQMTYIKGSSYCKIHKTKRYRIEMLRNYENCRKYRKYGKYGNLFNKSSFV